jgi:ribosomal protein S18 acetylase RimI-like enzyme
MNIKPATPDDLEIFRDIEIRAGRLFADHGMPEVAAYEPWPVAALARHQEAGHAWAAVDEGGQPVGYLIAEPVDGYLHIEQVSVSPEHGRQGIGRALLERAALAAATEGFPALTLTTFVEVPWNGPYYRRCGFRFLADGEVTPGLRAVRQREAEIGLDRWPRACMRRDLSASAT